MNGKCHSITTNILTALFVGLPLFQFYMVKELTDKLHLIKKRMLNMHQRVKHLKVESHRFVAFFSELFMIEIYKCFLFSTETFGKYTEAS